MMLMWTWITVELLLLLLDDNQIMLQLNLAWTRMACRWRERFCNWLHRIRKWGRDCPRGIVRNNVSLEWVYILQPSFDA